MSLPLFLLSLFWPPPFSMSLPLSLACSSIFFFLLVFFAFFWFLLFVSFFPFVSSLLLFHERNNIKTFNCTFLFSSIFSLFFCLVSCLASPFKSFLLILVFFADFKLFFVQHECFWLQNKQQKTQMFGQGGGCNKVFFFYQPVFCKMWKVIVFGGPFLGQILVDVQTTLFQQIFKAKNGKKMTIFFYVTNWAKLNVTNWAKSAAKKNNLAQLVTFQNCASTFFWKKKQICWNPIFV